MRREYETRTYKTQIEFDAGLEEMGNAGWRLHSWQYIAVTANVDLRLFFVIYELGA